jgi:hypothetical protein
VKSRSPTTVQISIISSEKPATIPVASDMLASIKGKTVSVVILKNHPARGLAITMKKKQALGKLEAFHHTGEKVRIERGEIYADLS